MSRTTAPWMRDGRTIYALQECVRDGQVQYRRGVAEMENRFSVSVQPGPGCTEKEAEAVAQLMVSAPDLLAALERLEGYVDCTPATYGHDCYWCSDCVGRLKADMRMAMAKAKGDV